MNRSRHIKRQSRRAQEIKLNAIRSKVRTDYVISLLIEVKSIIRNFDFRNSLKSSK